MMRFNSFSKITALLILIFAGGLFLKTLGGAGTLGLIKTGLTLTFLFLVIWKTLPALLGRKMDEVKIQFLGEYHPQDLAFIFILAIGGGIFVYYKTTVLGWLGIFLSFISWVLIILSSLIILDEESFK